MVLKPAPETPLDALPPRRDRRRRPGCPPGCSTSCRPTARSSEHLVAHPGIDKISFTGSAVAGRKIGAICGEQLKRCTLELGGKSAAIVLDDADLEATVAGLMPAAIMNNGQACVAQTRILASRARATTRSSTPSPTAAAAMKVGDPLDPATEVGPLVAAAPARPGRGLHRARAATRAPRVVTGGGRPAGFDKGWYVEPTVFADVDNTMTIAQEEIFGPVLSVIPYDDDDDAVRIANDSDYGLSGSVWTGDAESGVDVARRVRTGTFGVNGMGMDFVVARSAASRTPASVASSAPRVSAEYLEAKTIVLPQGFEPA